MGWILAFLLIFPLVSNYSIGAKLANEELQLEEVDGSIASSDEDDYNASDFFAADSIVLSGTFDRLHSGHKRFLTEAIRRANRRVVVGVHDVNITQTKILPELILPTETRIDDVRNFLQSINDDLTYEVIPIQEPFQAASSDSDLDVIIVSSRTLRNGVKTNEIRQSNGLTQLQILCVDVIETETDAEGNRERISSTKNRMKLLGKRLKTLVPKPHVPDYPHIIGLIGGIAAGKSFISQHFEEFGAKVINGDKLAHEVYEPGNECHAKIVEHFGDHILTEGNYINRTSLGAIVFADKKKLNELSQIVWPMAMDELQRRIEVIRTQKSHNVVIVEAAVLLQAGWQHDMHELWSVIIPRDLAIKRVMKRDGFSVEQATRRIDSQPSNDVMVKESTVVFSREWSDEFFKQQAETAWKELQEHLADVSNNQNSN